MSYIGEWETGELGDPIGVLWDPIVMLMRLVHEHTIHLFTYRPFANGTTNPVGLVNATTTDRQLFISNAWFVA